MGRPHKSQVVFGRQCPDLRHLRGQAEHMDDDDGAGAWRDPALHVGRVEAQALRLALAQRREQLDGRVTELKVSLGSTRERHNAAETMLKNLVRKWSNKTMAFYNCSFH